MLDVNHPNLDLDKSRFLNYQNLEGSQILIEKKLNRNFQSAWFEVFVFIPGPQLFYLKKNNNSNI